MQKLITLLFVFSPKAFLTFASSVQVGAKNGIHECKQQFMLEKWNCPESTLQLSTHNGLRSGKKCVPTYLCSMRGSYSSCLVQFQQLSTLQKLLLQCREGSAAYRALWLAYGKDHKYERRFHSENTLWLYSINDFTRGYAPFTHCTWTQKQCMCGANFRPMSKIVFSFPCPLL